MGTVYQKAMLNGKVRLLPIETSDRSREEYLKELENERRVGIALRRDYYSGSQYDEENAATLAQIMQTEPNCRALPEHRRRHAYCTTIAEAVEFLADQLATTFTVTGEDSTYDKLIQEVIRMSPDLCPSGDPDDVAVTEVLRDALVAGDVAVHVRYNSEADTAFFEFWESELVRFDWDEIDTSKLAKVYIESVVWVGEGDLEREVIQKESWEMVDGFCQYTQQIGDADAVTRKLRYMFIPWCLLRAEKKGMSAQRGESVITQQCMEAVNRYDAVEQLGWKIARYNSHSSVVITGDSAFLSSEKSETVNKDVADALTFPGGTNVNALSLPTDTQMIQHQHDVLLDSVYGMFGLARVDQTTIGNYSGLSGYGLEILNRKTDGTFATVRRQFSRDLKAALSMAVDVFESWHTEPNEQGNVNIESSVYENRKVEIHMGGAYIADDVMARDDFNANLVSRRQTLLSRGWTEEKIADNEREIAEQSTDIVSQSPIMSGRIKAGSTLTGSDNSIQQDEAPNGSAKP